MTCAELITHVEIAIQKAIKGESRLDAETLAIGGFSTPTMRHLFNNLCAEPVKTYLEVGAFRGATICAAACNNKHLTSAVIEDFSQPFGESGVREDLIENLTNVALKTDDIQLINEDCWKADVWDWPKFDVFFYDGEHSEGSQARALPHFIDALADNFIFVVDDYEWKDVRVGTWRGFDKLVGKVHIERMWEFLPGRPDDPIFHNGMAIFVCSKIPS